MQNTNNFVSVKSTPSAPEPETLIGQCFKDDKTGKIFILGRGGPRQCQFTSLSTGLRWHPVGTGRYDGVMSTKNFKLPKGLTLVVGQISVSSK